MRRVTDVTRTEEDLKPGGGYVERRRGARLGTYKYPRYFSYLCKPFHGNHCFS